ncbi:hypothetical protein HRH25_03240 [Flavisolibacter sp. BT320]|nr:hypothetical protein [Flavisolibacter longurius]
MNGNANIVFVKKEKAQCKKQGIVLVGFRRERPSLGENTPCKADNTAMQKIFGFGHFSLNLHRKPLRAHTLITHNTGRFTTNPRQIIIKRQQLTGF